MFLENAGRSQDMRLLITNPSGSSATVTVRVPGQIDSNVLVQPHSTAYYDVGGNNQVWPSVTPVN